MERRLVLCLVLSAAIMLGWSVLFQPKRPVRPKAVDAVAAKNDAKPGDKDDVKKKLPADDQKTAKTETPSTDKSATQKPDAKSAKKPAATPEMLAADDSKEPEQWITLGSVDPNSPYRMLVTLTNRGAAVARIELNGPDGGRLGHTYCDIDDRDGYLGHVVMDALAIGDGCLVQVVGAGTPAAQAGIIPGDRILSIAGKNVVGQESLKSALRGTKPGKKVRVVVARDGRELTLPVTLSRRPLEVIQPENSDPLSMLLTLQQFDDRRISDEEAKDEELRASEKKHDPARAENDAETKERLHRESIHRELKGVNLRTANWKVAKTAEKDTVKFVRTLPGLGLEITKTYRVVAVPKASQENNDYPAYHLEFEISIANIEEKKEGGAEPKTHRVAYRLDGPNGLPTEGAWYTTRVTRSGGSGIRDFVISSGGVPDTLGAMTIADPTAKPHLPWKDDSMTYVGIDALYFSAVLMPERKDPAKAWFEEIKPIYVGKVNPQRTNMTNTSCRLVSKETVLKPGDAPLTHKFKLFAGPKKPTVLEPYTLSDLVYFGWPIFAVVAVPLTKILHIFYAVVPNYGIAIILLTILVRGCMFPMSKKQALGALKMQVLQPEIKKLQEKHKNSPEARAKAQQELFQRHNYNPLSGCLPIFIQMPIFIGLYRSLMVAIELRDAPLLSHSIRWCSNLAAPDMLYDWSKFMPPWFNEGLGMFALGPYFNLLPILTIILFIWQQKVMMPPAADEQAAMQQKMMKYMMIFMGLMFFKVASGLCIYFIASSLWGMGERQFLPKVTPIASGTPETRADVKARDRKEAEQRRKLEEKKKK